jgi:hypothetical protein
LCRFFLLVVFSGAGTKSNGTASFFFFFLLGGAFEEFCSLIFSFCRGFSLLGEETRAVRHTEQEVAPILFSYVQAVQFHVRSRKVGPEVPREGAAVLVRLAKGAVVFWGGDIRRLRLRASGCGRDGDMH